MKVVKLCDKGNCTREACIKNHQYFPGLHLCTYHANKATKEGRIERKLQVKK
jgi:hypothetical protein